MIVRRVHAVATLAFLAAIVVQVFLAGLAIANLGGSGDFSTHIEFGYTWVGLAALAVLVTAILARPGRRDLAISAGLLVLYVVQTALPQARGSAPAIAALHPLNAMLLFVLAGWYARHAWRRGFTTVSAPAADGSAPATPAAADVG